MTIMTRLSEIDWAKLSNLSWKVRDNASIIGKTRVGASIVTPDGNYYTGCNVEHRFRNHDVHAEVNAITNMISSGEKKLDVILIVAERENFTPCGSCLDWIFQFGGSDCLVGVQSSINGGIKIFQAKELMPYYPY